MNNDLYFLRILTEALKAPNPEPEIRKAFDKIEKLGRQPEYKQGYHQFRQFMDKIKESGNITSVDSGDLSPEMIRDLVFQLATGLLDYDSKEGQRLLELIRSKPEWQKEFEKLSAQTLESEGLSDQMKIIVTKNGDAIGSIPAQPSLFAQNIKNVTPGYYEFRLNTGRVLWQADLREEDLLWSAAFPEEALDLAADTGESFRRITKEFTILGGEITIRVYPEIESGRIEVEVRDSQFEK
jgi:hypothetical protein